MTDDTITHEALAPCPFCGKEATGGWFCMEFNISCETPLCAGLSGPSAYAADYGGDSDKAKAAAIAAWNTRAPLTGPEVAAIRAEERERCAKIAEGRAWTFGGKDFDWCAERAGKGIASDIRALTDKETDHE